MFCGRSQTCWLEPACIVTPKSAHEVSIIIRVISALETKFAIRSGGHKPTPGFNSVGGDGILIALQNLNSLSISADRNTVTLGTGARWRDAYLFAKKHDKILVGGREPMVGVGGFLLGGGISLFVNTWGLALDLVTRFEVTAHPPTPPTPFNPPRNTNNKIPKLKTKWLIHPPQIVLPSGTILNATPTSHPSLFRALKGGLSNYGIITSFSILTKPLPKNAYYRVSQYTPQQTPALLKAYAEYLADPTTDTNTSVQIQCNSNYTAAFFGYITALPSDPPDFHRFSNLTVETTLIPATNGPILDSIILSLGGAASTLGNWVGLSFSHRITPSPSPSPSPSNSTSSKILTDCHALFRTASQTLPKGMYLTYVPQGILPSVIDIGTSTSISTIPPPTMPPGNIFGLERTPQFWVDLYVTYTHLTSTAHATRIVEELGKKMQEVVEREKVKLKFIFPSTAGGGQDVLGGYGRGDGMGKGEIERVARMYDAGGVMQRLLNDGYLLRNG
ncbi:MAG: hypothetical protein LQ350_007224 [Teloschistes chrysophthalmus]|nr:MAG: hypothetical protein LQ350_007224 [Niorma chrysophthalma]